jgi:hypothetical protein
LAQFWLKNAFMPFKDKHNKAKQGIASLNLACLCDKHTLQLNEACLLLCLQNGETLQTALRGGSVCNVNLLLGNALIATHSKWRADCISQEFSRTCQR